MLIYTDLLSSNNDGPATLSTAYMDMLITGANSTYGNIAGVYVSSGGTGYSNTNKVIFSGGGASTQAANASIITNASGVIASVTPTSNVGVGYTSNPTLTIANSSGGTTGVGTGAVLVPTFRLGFPTLTTGTIVTPLQDLLAPVNLTVGSISSLSEINPGENYNTVPFVLAVEPFVAEFDKHDYILFVTNATANFATGENIQQDLGGAVIAKGVVRSYDPDTGILYVSRRSVFNDFKVTGSNDLTGLSSGATATIISAQADYSTAAIGVNASISANVSTSGGSISSVKVINSGFGYVQDETVDLISEDGNRAAAGKTNIINHGTGEGYYSSTRGFLDDHKYIHDGEYYQEYSYEVQSSIPLDKYSELLKQVVHVSGTRLFGRVNTDTSSNVQITVANSAIVIS